MSSYSGCRRLSPTQYCRKSWNIILFTFVFFFIAAAGALFPANIFKNWPVWAFVQGCGLGHRFVETLPHIYTSNIQTGACGCSTTTKWPGGVARHTPGGSQGCPGGPWARWGDALWKRNRMQQSKVSGAVNLWRYGVICDPDGSQGRARGTPGTPWGYLESFS